METAEEDVGALPDDLHDASNILLLASSFTELEGEACGQLLTLDPPGQSAVLGVTCTRSPDAQLQRWRSHLGQDPPAATAIITLGEDTRGAATADAASAPDRPIQISTVASPGNLTQLGVEITSVLSRWEGSPHRIVVCVDSLTTLLQYVDLDQLFRFLHVLTSRIEEAGARAHYHVTPDAHDQQTINTLLILFDAVLEEDGEAGWQVRRR